MGKFFVCFFRFCDIKEPRFKPRQNGQSWSPIRSCRGSWGLLTFTFALPAITADWQLHSHKRLPRFLLSGPSNWSACSPLHRFSIIQSVHGGGGCPWASLRCSFVPKIYRELQITPMCLFSYCFSLAEQNYTGNCEHLAVVLTLQEWRHWLEGATYLWSGPTIRTCLP